jgi:deazaflavin-dependent oxidoreductase (nitroreductase family)
MSLQRCRTIPSGSWDVIVHDRGPGVPVRHMLATAASVGWSVSDTRERVPRIPPRWFVRLAWYAHRALYRVTGGRVGLWRARPNRWGTLRLTTSGRRTHQERSVILGYLEDGPNLVTMAMNGWAEGEPAWWLNLQANPNATVVLAGGARSVKARAAGGAERSRLWAKWREVEPNLDGYAALRSSETALVILEPRR